MRGKYFVLGWPEQPRQEKSLLYRHDEPNEPTTEEPLSFVLFESPFASVSTVSRGHPSLVSLMLTAQLPWTQHASKKQFQHMYCTCTKYPAKEPLIYFWYYLAWMFPDGWSWLVGIPSWQQPILHASDDSHACRAPTHFTYAVYVSLHIADTVTNFQNKKVPNHKVPEE